MKRSLPLYLLLLVLSLCCACTDHHAMMQRLAYVSACNRADTVFTSRWLPTVDSLVSYFDRYGSPNDRMMAHYLQGRVYHDMGEAPRAIDCYQEAVSCADTTAADCNYYLLSRIFCQKAELFYQQMLPNEMLEELLQAQKYAKLCNDTTTYLIAYERQNSAYSLLNQQDSALSVIENAFQAYQQYGYDDLAANAASTMFIYMVEQKKWKDAKAYMDIYERHSRFFKNGEIIPGRELFYYYKGCYYAGIGLNDSASYYYHKELLLAQNTQDANNMEAAYKGLYELYKSIGLTDSVAKYADLCYLTSDEQYQQSSAEELRHMHALYNYDRNQLLAMTKTKEVAEMRLYLFAIILFTLLLSVSIVFRIRKWRRHKQEELQAIVMEKQREIQLMQEKYDEMMQQQEHARIELTKIQESTYEALLREKESEILKRQSEIDELERVLHAKLSIDEEMLSSYICRRFHYYANHPLDNFSSQEMDMLIEMVEQKIPSFYITLHSGKSITQFDYFVCVLIRLQFAQVEISSLTGIASPNLTRKRRQLLTRCFGIQGSAEKFNEIVTAIR